MGRDSEAGPPTDDDHEVEVETRELGSRHGRALGQASSVSSTLPYMDRFHCTWSSTIPAYVPAEWQYSGFGDLLTIGQVACSARRCTRRCRWRCAAGSSC